MAKNKGKRKPPSRERYEKEHRTRSCRLTKDENRRLDELLEETGCSFGDFVRDWLGREESMIKERVEMLAKKKSPLSIEDRLRCLEELMFQTFIYLRDHDWSPSCPRCTNQELLIAWGDEVGSTRALKETPTLKCPSCGYFLDNYNKLEPESVKCDFPSASKPAPNLKSPPSKKRRKC